LIVQYELSAGEHPRMGALDVCPFIPVQNVSMEDCVECAREFGEKLAIELGVPGKSLNYSYIVLCFLRLARAVVFLFQFFSILKASKAALFDNKTSKSPLLDTTLPSQTQ